MVASILIIGFSLVLLVYWFRYSCLLLLRNSAANPSAIDPRFGFGRAQEELNAGGNTDPLYRALKRDYRLVTYLVEHAAGLNLPSLEDRLLVIDYNVMQVYYRVMKIAAPRQARRALAEMAAVLNVLVLHMSEQAGVQVRS
jgi:hypothetical protein